MEQPSTVPLVLTGPLVSYARANSNTFSITIVSALRVTIGAPKELTKIRG